MAWSDFVWPIAGTIKWLHEIQWPGSTIRTGAGRFGRVGVLHLNLAMVGCKYVRIRWAEIGQCGARMGWLAADALADDPQGYGTAKHMAAIKELGPCRIHRRTFAPLKHMDLPGKE